MDPRPTLRARRTEAAFSFIEILVVMGMIAVLAGIGIAMYGKAIEKAAAYRTNTLLQTVRVDIDHFQLRFKAYPPSRISQLPNVLGTKAKIGRTTPDNTTNMSIESAYQSFVAPGLDINPRVDGDRTNTDRDALDGTFDPKGDRSLYEIKDDYGNPLVYMVEGDYVTFDKDPPTYVDKDGVEFHPKPWKTAEGSGYAESHGYQLFSIGRDGIPNTEDDLKAWR